MKLGRMMYNDHILVPFKDEMNRENALLTLPECPQRRRSAWTSTERLVWECHCQGSHQVRIRGRQGNGVPWVKGGKIQFIQPNP